MLKELDMAGAIVRLKEGSEKIVMLVPVTKETPLDEFIRAKGFALLEYGRPDKTEKTEQTEKPKTERKRPKQIDTGKILALHKAGWSSTKIANEIGCSPQTVLNHIERQKAKEENADE